MFNELSCSISPGVKNNLDTTSGMFYKSKAGLFFHSLADSCFVNNIDRSNQIFFR